MAVFSNADCIAFWEQSQRRKFLQTLHLRANQSGKPYKVVAI